MLPGFDGNGRPMMPPDEAARRAAFTSRNMRNIRFMTQPRRFPPPSTSQTDQQEEEKEEIVKNPVKISKAFEDDDADEYYKRIMERVKNAKKLY